MPTPKTTPPTGCQPLPEPMASTLLRDWARPRRLRQALAMTRASPNSRARAERAVALTQVQSLPIAARRARRRQMRAYAGDGSRPVMLLSAQIRWAR